MRHPLSSSRAQAVRATLVFVSLALAAGCGGGSSGNNPAPPLGPCNPDAQVQLARPLQGSTGNVSNLTSIEIVANGNNNQLYSSYAQYQLVAIPSFGGTFSSTGNLRLTSDPNGYAPFPSDYYYAASFNNGQFVPGTVYSIYLNVQSTNCQPSFVGSFST